MTTNDGLRQQIVSRVSAREPEEVAKLAVQWWSVIAAELITLVGQDGFDMLFSRSVVLTQKHFPWLAPQQVDLSFTSLRASLEASNSDDAFKASVELFVIFTDLLTEFIGETLTSNITNAVWGDASRTGIKGVNHE